MSTTVPESTKLTPEALIAQLRVAQSQLDEIAPLSRDERTLVQKRVRNHSQNVVEASINVLGVLDNVAQAIGQPLDDVRQMQDDTLRWEAAAEEVRAFLKGLEGANLIRRRRLTVIAMQAYTIGTQLAKDPEKAVLLPHIEEVKRLKGLARRKKTQEPAGTAPAQP